MAKEELNNHNIRSKLRTEEPLLKTNRTFEELHPDVMPDVQRYERTDCADRLLELWVRKNGKMVNMTEIELLQRHIASLEQQTKERDICE